MAPRIRPHVNGGHADRPHVTERPPGYMLPTYGDRDHRCHRIAACLSAHVRAHPDREGGRTIYASCPAVCRWREPMNERATDYMRSGTSNL